jgi:hypothetical protein
MAQESIDWGALAAAAGSGDFDALPAGDYDLKCVSAEYKTTGNGKPMWVAKFQVMNGQYAKRMVWHNFVLSPDSEIALGIFFRQMAVFGMTKEWFTTTKPSTDAVINTLVGREVRAGLGIKKYNGTDRNEIKALAPLPGNAPPPVGGVSAAAPPPPPPPAPAAATPPPPPPAPAPAPAPAPVAAEVAAPAAPPVPEPAPAPAEPQVDIPIPPPPSF